MPRRSAWADYVPPDTATYPHVEPMFGPALLHHPASQCGHRGPLPAHSRSICMCCHQTGADTQALIDRVAAHERRHGINQVEPETKAGPSLIKHKPRGRK